MHDVLVVEDEHALGQIICLLLQALGFRVLWVTKILAVLEGGARVLCADPNTPIQEIRIFERTICWSDFAVALVDGTLGETWQDHHGPHGWDIVPGIVAAGVFCIAMSTDIFFNKRMTGQGAQFATVRKRYKNFEPILIDFLQQLKLLPSE